MIATGSTNERKHENRNPLQRALIGRFHRELARLVRTTHARSLLEIGCGEGYVLRALHQAGLQCELRGLDISAAAVAAARDRIGHAATIEHRNVRELVDDGHRSDVVLAIEMLEHLQQPHEMLAMIRQLTNRYVVLSVPHEPWFQLLNLLRGRDLARLGNHPEHVQRWTRRGFLRLIGAQFRIIAAPWTTPWTLVLAEVAPW